MIPVVDRSQTIQNYLKQAEEEPLKPVKFRNYYLAAKLQCKSGLFEDAKNTCALAQSVQPDGVESLFKIAKIAIMINPQCIPRELEDAENHAKLVCSWAKEQSGRSLSCGQVISPILTVIAKRYFQLNLPDKGTHYLHEAIKWSNCGGEPLKMTRNDLKIVKVCIKENQLDACMVVVQKMEGYIPLLENDEIKANYMLKLAELILPIDKDYGETLLSKAKTCTGKNNEKEIKGLDSERSQTIQNYLKKAEEEPLNPNKFRNYYLAAKLQCQSGLIEDAKNTCTVAKIVMPDGLDSLLKIAKIAIMINPQCTPRELEDAENRAEFACSWALHQSSGKMSCGQAFAPTLALIAKRYFQLNLLDKGKHYLQEAIRWSNYGGKLLEMTQNDVKIIKVCIRGNQLDSCINVVKKMEGYIPLYECNEIQAKYTLALAELVLPINKDYGRTLLSQAETWTDKNNEYEINELDRVTQLYNA